jgi:hypothetical protein
MTTNGFVSVDPPSPTSDGSLLARMRMILAWIDALLTGSAPPMLPFSFPAEPRTVTDGTTFVRLRTGLCEIEQIFRCKKYRKTELLESGDMAVKLL